MVNAPIPVKSEIYKPPKSILVMPLIFAVNTWPSISPESRSKSVKACSKLASGIAVFWLKQKEEANTKSNSNSYQ